CFAKTCTKVMVRNTIRKKESSSSCRYCVAKVWKLNKTDPRYARRFKAIMVVAKQIHLRRMKAAAIILQKYSRRVLVFHYYDEKIQLRIEARREREEQERREKEERERREKEERERREKEER